MPQPETRLRGLHEVAEMLDVKPWNIQYAHAARHVAPPPLRVCNKRLYDEETIDRLRLYFAGRVVRRGRAGSGPQRR